LPEPAPAATPPLQAEAPKPAAPVVAATAVIPQETAAEVQPLPAIAETKLPDPAPVPATAPAVVATLGPDKAEPPAKNATEDVAASAAAPAAVEAVPAQTEPQPPAQAGDTLKADDKAIAAPKVAAINDPAMPEIAPIPANEVKLPAPRVDPAEIEAQRKRLLAQKAKARVAKARRLAAARARAAAQAAKAAQSNPFGAPSVGSSTNTTARSGS
jgi:hypothetical protein